MKFASVLFLTLIFLTGCAQGPGKIDAAAVRQMAPDVPPVDAQTQAKAAGEITGGMCPALTTMASVCLITRDQSRALADFK